MTVKRAKMDTVDFDTPMFKDVVVLGCGNILFGDDGFGTHVADHLKDACPIPEHVSVINAGTGVREVLFDLAISDKKPRKVIVVDAIDVRRRPGEVFQIGIEEIPQHKTNDFALHHMPTSNLLRELRDTCNVEIVIVVAQVEDIPDAVSPGLSKTLADSVAVAAGEVLAACG